MKTTVGHDTSPFRLPLVKFAPFYVLGLLTAFYFPVPVCAALAALSAAVMILPKLLGRRISVCALGLSAGIILSALYCVFYFQPILENCGKTVNAYCVITDTVSSSDSGAVYDASLTIEGRTVSARLYGSDMARTGDGFSAVIELSETDAEGLRSALSRGTFLTGSIIEYGNAEPKFNIISSINALRAKISSKVKYYLSGDDRALALSMLFGDSSMLTTRLGEEICVSGASHFTAVSGLHFSICFAIFLELMAGRMKMLRAYLSLLLIPMAVIFFGASASVLRSAVMLAICSCSPIVKRKSETLNSLCLAVVLMTAGSPGIIFNAGFQMSVLGVLGSGVVGARLHAAIAEKLPEKYERIGGVIRPFVISLCAVICTSPAAVYYFGGISLAGPLTSALVSPLMAPAMLLVMTAGITNLDTLIIPAALVMKIIRAIIGFFGGIGSLWLPMDFRGAVWLSALSAALITAAAASGGKTRRRIAAGFPALVLASLTLCLTVRGSRCRVEFISNGRSGAAIIISETSAAVYISGTGAGLSDELAERLRRSGIQRVSFIAAPEADCCGAVALGELTRLVPTDRIYSAENAGLLGRVCPESEIVERYVNYITAADISISAASVGGEPAEGDIVMYTGYIRSAPASGDNVALYVSSRQKELPENGINIYKTEYKIELREIGRVEIH